MKRTLLSLLVLVGLLVGAGGCAAEAGDAQHDEPAATTEQALAFASMSGNCYWGGGYTWCQDYYTAKWCTSSYSSGGWDWTNCAWKGWNRDGSLYCSNGWQWGSSHKHCD